MNELRQGIVLKSYLPHKKKIAIIDRVWGRIDCVPDHERICVGALLIYRADSHKAHCLIRDIEQYAVPFALAREDIVFFHHVLEICFHGIPLASCEPAVFQLLLSLYRDLGVLTVLYKKVFIAKLFFLLGMYTTDNPAIQQKLLPHLNESVDTAIDRFIELGLEADIDAWLRMCMEVYPYRDRFKTVNFLYKSGTI